MRSIGTSVSEGGLPSTALALVALSAVMREGSEAVFFLFGAARTAPSDGWSLFTGGLLGAGAALAIGSVLYLGLSRIPLKRLFSVASWLLMLMAAGMVSEAAANLVIIEWLPALGERLWDISGLLSTQNLFGDFLHVLIGYDPAPSGVQVLAYGLALTIMVTLYRRTRNRPRKAAESAARPVPGGMPQAKPAQ